MIAYQEVFDRHPGVYDVMHTTERPGKKGVIEDVRINTHHHLTAGAVVALVRQELEKDEYAVLTIFAATRGDTGCIGWINKGNIDHMFREVPDEREQRMELPDERGEAALLPRRRPDEPVREVGDPPPAGEVQRAGTVQGPRPVRRVPTQAGRGKALVIGTGEWPGSAAAHLVRDHFSQPNFKATPAEAVAAIGAKLIEMGVAFPASLISRLKQRGLLVTAPEEE